MEDKVSSINLLHQLELIKERLGLIAMQEGRNNASVKELLGEVELSLQTYKKEPQVRIFDMLSDEQASVLTVNTKGDILACSTGIFKLTGYHVEDIIGQNIYKFLFSDVAIDSPLPFHRLSYLSKLKIKGSSRMLYVSVRIFHEEDGVYTLMLEDITDYILAAEKYKRDDSELKEFFSRSSDFILVFDDNGNLLFVNDTCSNVLGFDELEILEKNLYDLTGDNKKEFVKELVEEVKQTGRSKELSIEFLDRQGTKLVLEGHLNCRRSYVAQSPNIYRMFLTNVTEKLKTERKLNRQEARLEAMFESGEQSKWVIDKDYRVIRFNKNFEDLLLTAHDFEMYKGVKVPDLHRSKREYVEKWLRHYEKAFNGEAQKFEVATKNKYNQTYWLDVVLSPVIYEDGDIREVYVIAQDITVEKKTEIELKASETKFSSVFQSLRDVVYFRTDIDGNMQMVTPSVYELTGWTQEEAEKMSLADFYMSETTIKEEIAPRLLKDREIKNFQHRIVHSKTQEVKDVSITFWLTREFNGELVVQGVAKDVSSWKQINAKLEEEKETAKMASEVKKQFLSKMSHEMRTPLNGIMGKVQLLKETKLTKEQVNHLRIISTTTATLQGIIDDILDWSKIEAGKMDLNPQPIDIRLTANNIYEVHSPLAEEKGLSLSVEVSSRVPKVLETDEMRVQQVLTNLVSNAVKYTKTGFVKVRIDIRPKFMNKYILMFEVEDSGIGIKLEDKDYLFDSYKRLDDSYSKSLKGTGLGLAIARELTQMMGGDIGVESEMGQGSLFWFTIEVKEVKGVKPANLPQEEEDAFGRSFVEAPEVLFVDDNTTNRQIGHAFLEKVNCNITEAVDGQEAVDWMKRKTFDLVLMDIQMPVMNGVEATRYIKENHPEIQTPIVALTAFILKEQQKEFFEAGMEDVVTKPFTAAKLVSKVYEHLRGRPDGERFLMVDNDLIESRLEEPEVEEIEEVEEVEQVEEEQVGINLSEDLLNGEGEIVINMQPSRDLYRFGGDELIDMSFSSFLEETEEMIEGIEEGLEKNDVEMVRSNMHTIKGTAGTLGIIKLAEAAKKGEGKLKAGNASDLVEDAVAVKQFYNEFKQVYDGWYKSL